VRCNVLQSVTATDVLHYAICCEVQLQNLQQNRFSSQCVTSQEMEARVRACKLHISLRSVPKLQLDGRAIYFQQSVI
jgi:hypothetical protein